MDDLDALRAALAASPDNEPLLMLFAKACMENWELDEAREAYERVCRLNPQSEVAQLGLVGVLHALGDLSLAVVRIEEFLSTRPQHGQGHLLHARILADDQDRGGAISAYERAIKLDRNLMDAKLAESLRIPVSGRESEPPQRMATTSQGPIRDDDGFGDQEWSEFSGGAGPELPAFAQAERPDINFAKVGGMEALKEEIRMKVLHPMNNPDLFKAYGKKIGGGVLMYGPPGCGKTMLARATAGEIEANFLCLGLHDILDMYIGNSEKNLHAVFEYARANAPCVLFFDEVDALAADRKDLRQSAGRSLINQLLAEMDGGTANNDGILILGATNAPWHIDPAFRRPGRFDRTLFVPPPDEPARATILEIMAEEKPTDVLDFRKLANKTAQFSGADLKAVFDIATESVLTQAMKTGKVIPLGTKDLLKAAKLHRATTKAWFESARNYALYANQGGLYDEVLSYLGIKK